MDIVPDSFSLGSLGGLHLPANLSWFKEQLPVTSEHCASVIRCAAEFMFASEARCDYKSAERMRETIVHLRYRYLKLKQNNSSEELLFIIYYEATLPSLVFGKTHVVDYGPISSIYSFMDSDTIDEGIEVASVSSVESISPWETVTRKSKKKRDVLQDPGFRSSKPSVSNGDRSVSDKKVDRMKKAAKKRSVEKDAATMIADRILKFRRENHITDAEIQQFGFSDMCVTDEHTPNIIAPDEGNCGTKERSPPLVPKPESVKLLTRLLEATGYQVEFHDMYPTVTGHHVNNFDLRFPGCKSIDEWLREDF